MFDSSGYVENGNPGKDLLFKDATINLASVGIRDEYDEYLSPEYVKDLDAINCEDTSNAAFVNASMFLISLLSLLAVSLKAI